MATSPSNATTQEYTQGVNEIAQNDLNRQTFQTDLNQTPVQTPAMSTEGRVRYDEQSDLAGNLFYGDEEDFVLTYCGECDICGDDTEPLFTLPCNHTFGLKCISLWVQKKHELQQRTTCPMCRAPF